MGGMKAFVSYSYEQGGWVWDRLVPVLKAGGAEVLIDRERFVAGKTVVSQMDAWQDKADRHVLAISRDYLKSEFCLHEMDRAVARDPGFQRSIVLPVRLDNSKLPAKISRPSPLCVDLRNDEDAVQWKKLLDACEADLGTAAPVWLGARDEVRRFLSRNESVNLVVKGEGVKWRELIGNVASDDDPKRSLRHLGVVNLSCPTTLSRPGLVSEITKAFGASSVVPKKPDDLAELARCCVGRNVSHIALQHFDLVADRITEYEPGLFSTLFHLVMEAKKLIILVQSRRPFHTLIPPNHQLSSIDMKTVELLAHS